VEQLPNLAAGSYERRWNSELDDLELKEEALVWREE